MPLPLPPPPSFPGTPPVVPLTAPVPLYAQPYYIRQTQDWAIDQERMRHNQALYSVGEWTMFVLMWHIQDFNRKLVARCPKCFVAYDKVTEAYGQSSQNKCSDCFGSTFEGGFKAIIVRPAIFSDTDEGEKFDRRGTTHSGDVDVESTIDFRVRTGDYVFRVDGTRWQLRVPQRITLRTGFEFAEQSAAAIGYNHARASLEDPTAVAYMIQPDAFTLRYVLQKNANWPIDFTEHEVRRGTISNPSVPAPLIPDDLDVETDPNENLYPGHTTFPSVT